MSLRRAIPLALLVLVTVSFAAPAAMGQEAATIGSAACIGEDDDDTAGTSTSISTTAST